MDFSVEADVSDVLKAFDSTTKNMKSIQKGVLTIVGKGTQKQIKTITRTIKGNGLIRGRYPYEVSKAIIYHVVKDASKVSVFPKKIEKGRRNDLTIPLFTTLNYGAKITAIRHKYLTYKVGEEWRKTKAVNVPGKHFIEAGQMYAESNQYMADIEAYVDKELKKYWG